MRFRAPKVKTAVRSLLTLNGRLSILPETTSMRDAYLILCHDAPAQLNALATHLAAGGHDVFIHLDAKASIRHLVHTNACIRLIAHPSDVRWGGWTQVEATLKLLAAARRTGRHYRYLHLLSGQCMPLLSHVSLNDYLAGAAAEGRQFIECEPLPRAIWKGTDGGLHRVQVYFPSFIVSKYEKLHNDFFWPYIRAWRHAGLHRPGFRKYAPFYGGAQWFSLTGDCIAALHAAMEASPGLVRFFHHAFCSDELFFPTFLARTPYAGNAAGNARYVRWGQSIDLSPQVLAPADWPAAQASGCLFARKFSFQPGECSRFLASLP